MAIAVKNGRWGMTAIISDGAGGWTTSAMEFRIAPTIEVHYPPLNVARTGYTLPFALVHCTGTITNTDPDTVLIPRDIDLSEMTIGDLTAAQRTAVRTALVDRLTAYEFTDWDGTLKQIAAFVYDNYTLATPLRTVVRDIYAHLFHSDSRPRPASVETHNTEYTDDFSTDPASRWTAELGTYTWDSANSELDLGTTAADYYSRYSANGPGSLEHESQSTFVSNSNYHNSAGPAIRCGNTGADEFYTAAIRDWGDQNEFKFYRFNAGARTLIYTGSFTSASGDFITFRAAASGTAGANVALEAYTQNHGSTKPSNPGWIGTPGSPNHTYTDTSADRLDDSTNDQCGVATVATGGTDLDTRHCYWREQAISDRSSGSTGTIAVVLAAFNANITGTTTIIGTISNTLSNFISAFTGTTTVVGSISNTLSTFISNISGTVSDVVSGIIDTTLAAFTSVVQGTSTIVGTIANTLSAFIASITGTTSIIGTISNTLGSFISNIAGSAGTVIANIISRGMLASQLIRRKMTRR